MVEWTVAYVENHLDDWITLHGGWQGFLDLYNQDDDLERDWSNPQTYLGFAVSLIGFLTLGTLLYLLIKSAHL